MIFDIYRNLKLQKASRGSLLNEVLFSPLDGSAILGARARKRKSSSTWHPTGSKHTGRAPRHAPPQLGPLANLGSSETPAQPQTILTHLLLSEKGWSWGITKVQFQAFAAIGGSRVAWALLLVPMVTSCGIPSKPAVLS
jgi:hypothetical protein